MSKSALGEVRGALRGTYRRMLESGGATSPQLIMRFRADHPEAFAAAKDELAELGLSAIARGLLKAPSANSNQPDLFGVPADLRVFVPNQISVPTRSNAVDRTGDDVRWILFRSATFPEFVAHVGMLADSVEADRARLGGLYALLNLVRPIMEGISTMTISEAFAELKRRVPNAA